MLQQVLTLSTLERTPLGVGLSVVPGDGGFFDLDVGARGAFGVVGEDLGDFGEPGHVEAGGEVGPSGGAGGAEEAAVFGAHAEVGERAPVVFEEGGVATGDDVDDVARVGGECFEGADGVGGGDGGGGGFDDRGERALQARKTLELVLLYFEKER